MNPLSIVRGIDEDLLELFEQELENQQTSLSFIPDENPTSPICAALMSSILVNSSKSYSDTRHTKLESLTIKRLCSLFDAKYANVRTVTIEAASRVVFQALTKRGDVIMSLDLRKKEHCNSENLAYRFINFAIEPNSGMLDYDDIEKQALECKPQMIIVSPINYPLTIDYKRLSKIAKLCGAYLWCDISQVAGLVAAKVLPSPMPYADVVTFTSHGAMQGPQAAIILCSDELSSSIDRVVLSSGHCDLQSSQLSALAIRIKEMQNEVYTKYAQEVLENAKALSRGLLSSGVKLIANGTQTHLVMVDTKNCALSARGLQELLAETGILVRICTIYTNDPNVKYEAVRFSTFACTTRNIKTSQLEKLGQCIGDFLQHPDDEHMKKLQELRSISTMGLAQVSPIWLTDEAKNNLVACKYYQTDSSNLLDRAHQSRKIKLTRKAY